ncbi:hypothetical protein [Haladaptatus sp. NG-SE-30]
MIGTGTKTEEATTPETARTDEMCQDDEPVRRSFSLRALLPGPYVRYPK